jgi:hypothetical protein
VSPLRSLSVISAGVGICLTGATRKWTGVSTDSTLPRLRPGRREKRSLHRAKVSCRRLAPTPRSSKSTRVH